MIVKNEGGIQRTEDNINEIFRNENKQYKNKDLSFRQRLANKNYTQVY